MNERLTNKSSLPIKLSSKHQDGFENIQAEDIIGDEGVFDYDNDEYHNINKINGGSINNHFRLTEVSHE